MYSDGHEVDGSWVLCVYVTNLQTERSLRVKGELHIGGVMLRLVEDLGAISISFFHPFAACLVRKTSIERINPWYEPARLLLAVSVFLVASYKDYISVSLASPVRRQRTCQT
ncbi:hypothetical protein K0M31_016847 [Melipona bicolor]|uniref:Kindlin-2 N-terminal domain-containing protein n=1 Tax=Melipona bicolor TaxID=60889 RepID=A0AA40FE10_9HYME|nr:hypothetical protein K0M31_016847 [Melipona bicolor]